MPSAIANRQSPIGNPTPHVDAARVAAYLIRHCLGRAHAIRKSELAEHLDLDERELHDILAYLTETGVRLDPQGPRRRLPVCAACAEPMGYYVAISSEERRAYVHSLTRRALCILRRRKALRTAPVWPRVPAQQLDLFIADDTPADTSDSHAL